MTATRNNPDNTSINKTKTISEKNNSMDISSEISQDKNLTWLRKGNLKRETEFLLIAAQNAIRTISKQEKA